MFDSDSDHEQFIPAVLNRPKVANHIVHETFTVDTQDHEDHTFCGVMFDVCCRGEDEGGVPIEFLQIDTIAVRGDLGPLTVWTTPDTFRNKQHDMDAWKLVYEKDHEPSREACENLVLTEPIRLVPGETCGLYVHSKLPGDDAIVYDNQRGAVTYEDPVFRVLPGVAHLSNRPFGRNGMWGFPWRDNREFVGRVSYGVGYMLWNPDKEVHRRFPREFRQAVKTCLLCARRPQSPLHWLQDEVVFYILNMCRHDWFSPAPALQPAPKRRPPARAGAPWWARPVRWSRTEDSDDSDADLERLFRERGAASSGSAGSAGAAALLGNTDETFRLAIGSDSDADDGQPNDSDDDDDDEPGIEDSSDDMQQDDVEDVSIGSDGSDSM